MRQVGVEIVQDTDTAGHKPAYKRSLAVERTQKSKDERKSNQPEKKYLSGNPSRRREPLVVLSRGDYTYSRLKRVA